ncbi:hypothetical protein IW140_000121 [Coemansia sp. RSA 1813]|nr:hypothetical protein EV178_000075 [Coemansia sp. RSA 1646]KAJ1772285.1 hypothetical protein LPJ74_001550 [Coemansia sp. RSA 1843]KAJ2093226.1 hypothetical protein IW138_000519 [Coemansia sp. RSA 986]KAJ2217509.1 hypothetical protein EV179_000343 [Coemansia sp. RSA 487]KAJ2573479.1 hypothetical protein IW140_000121 [Coemansia sp. RSA 1813]
MKVFVPYAFAAVVAFVGTAVGQDNTDTGLGTDVGAAVSPTQTPANVDEQIPVPMMPGPVTGGASFPQMQAGNANVHAQMPNIVQSLLGHLASFFDLSHVSGITTNTPVSLDTVYDPAEGKFTMLSTDIQQSGDIYYVPVCSVDSIISNAPASAQACAYGVRLNPVPSNVAQAKLHIIRTLFAVLRNLARPLFGPDGSNMMSTGQQ